MDLKINDILYTKDGRKSGNLVVIDVFTIEYDGKNSKCYKMISDYGNIITNTEYTVFKYFYKKTGVADETHKYHNYKENYPELFI